MCNITCADSRLPLASVSTVVAVTVTASPESGMRSTTTWPSRTDGPMTQITCNGERWYRFTVPRTGPFTVIITGNGNTNDRYVASVEGANQTDIPIAGTASSYYINGWYQPVTGHPCRFVGNPAHLMAGLSHDARCITRPYEFTITPDAPEGGIIHVNNGDAIGNEPCRFVGNPAHLMAGLSHDARCITRPFHSAVRLHRERIHGLPSATNAQPVSSAG